ncbi:MAG: metal-dependent hydrolase [Thermoprotei archaeon]|nr:MAG: metal-dependent hydrolase [Thermoprotei archaeon]RLF02084.1 MAG: metal-dependent hydrolase [Thermoprotei archaeon]
MKDYVKWLGHAAFELMLDGKRILIDPWIRGNPKAAVKLEDIEDVDIILVTHDHGDHLGDSIEIAEKFDAKLISVYEIAVYASNQGVRNAIGMNVGGDIEVDGLKIVMTPSLHSSERGCPVGFIIVGSKNTVYHAGDTGFFSDIKYYAEVYPIDVALVPIGGVYTMNPVMAARFVALFKPRIAVPMHYGTFDVIEKDPKEFKDQVERKEPTIRVIILGIGDKLEL